MATIQLVVAVGQDDQRRCGANPPAEIFEQIERRRVGPMHVLEHEHGWLLANLQLVQESAEDREPVGGGSHQLQQRAFDSKRDVIERTQRLRREQRIAPTEQRARLGAMRGEEVFDQGGLADPSLAGHQRDAPLAGRCLAQRVGKAHQRRLTLEQLHGAASASVTFRGGRSLLKYPRREDNASSLQLGHHGAAHAAAPDRYCSGRDTGATP